MLDRLLGSLLPRHCKVCARPCEEDFCPACWRELPWQHQQCRLCALPLPQPQAAICGACLHTPPAQTAAWTPFIYAHPLSTLMLRLKFAGELAIAPVLGRALCQALPTHTLDLERVDYLVPAPLHPRRLRQRGFNQALELCRPLAHRHALPIRQDLLQRRNDTAVQSRLSASARRRNVRHAFTCRQRLQGEHVLLFDDVMTTGATMQAMGRCLLQHGAGRISQIAVARAP